MEFNQLSILVEKQLKCENYDFDSLHLEVEDYHMLLQILKSKDFFVDQVCGKINDKTIKCLKNQNKILKDYYNQIKLFNKLFKRKHRLLSKIIRKISPEYVFGAFIRAFQRIMRAKTNAMASGSEIDQLNTNWGKVFKSFTYDKRIYSPQLGFKYSFYDPNNLGNEITAYLYLKKYLKLANLDFIYDLWKIGCIEISGSYLSPSFNLIKNQKLQNFCRNYSKNTDKMMPYNYLAIFDYNNYETIIMSQCKELMAKKLYLKDIDALTYNGLALSKIIKSLAALKKDRHFKSDNFVSYDVGSWAEILNLTYSEAQTFLDLFSLSNRSSDFMDYPIFKLQNGCYGYIPILIGTLSIPNMLESFLVNNSSKIINKNEGSKGIRFENYVSQCLLKNNIPYIKNYIAKNKLEIDLMFIVENTLYICECKCKKYGIYAQTYLLEKGYTSKILRNIDYIKKNLQYVLDIINTKSKIKNKSIQISTIKGLLLNAYPFCKAKEQNNIICVDIDNFDNIFRETQNINKILRSSELFEKLLLTVDYLPKDNGFKIERRYNKLLRFKHDYLLFD